MRNVNMSVSSDGKKLLIEVDLEARLGKSASGKSVTIATTEGNVACPTDESIKIGLNVYQRA